MTEQRYRIESDSMGELRVPADALWQASTQRAVENFPVSNLRMPRAFIRALGLIKQAAAQSNAALGLLDAERAEAIVRAASQVAAGEFDAHFPVDVFQTGSGTSSNMNANEVIATLAREQAPDIQPNDHVNLGQSSNDVIPSAIHLSAALCLSEDLLPALDSLALDLECRAEELQDVVKTGRTHLMDAMPLTLGQELGGWARQLRNAIERLRCCQPRLHQLALGGTAIGTGINAHPEFASRAARQLSELTGLLLQPADNFFEAISAQDTAVELSGHLRTLAVSLMKIANDLRWMNSGPLAGLGEIELPALQPGSSIMPGKVNPVIPESVAQVCAQVIGNDAAIAVAGQSGNFQLNVMLPVIAHNLLQSIELLASAASLLGERAIRSFTVRQQRLQESLARNPVLVTALNPVIGYLKAAEIAKQAYREGRPVIDVAAEQTSLSRDELERLLDPRRLTRGGIQG